MPDGREKLIVARRKSECSKQTNAGRGLFHLRFSLRRFDVQEKLTVWDRNGQEMVMFGIT